MYHASLDPKAKAYSLRRLAYNPYGWLAGLSHSLGLLMAYGGLYRLATAYEYKHSNKKIKCNKLAQSHQFFSYVKSNTENSNDAVRELAL